MLQTELTKDGELLVTVESTLNTTNCRRCGGTINERHLILQLVNSTLSDVEAKEDVTYDALIGILDRWIAHSVHWDALPSFAMIGIDEIALLKGHRDFVTVVSAQTADGELHLLAILANRLKNTVVARLQTMPPVIPARITTVCTNIWDGYIIAVQEVLPEATIVIGRFHVARHYRDGVDTLRKQEVKRSRKNCPNRRTPNSNGHRGLSASAQPTWTLRSRSGLIRC